MTDDAIVQAAARAMRGHDCADVVAQNIPYLARTAVEAAEPLIRADQREKDAALIEAKVTAEQERLAPYPHEDGLIGNWVGGVKYAAHIVREGGTQ